MAKQEQSDKSRYYSKYSEGYVTDAQYITELICLHKAKNDLPFHFWKQPEWASFFRQQIASAHKLLKEYPVKAIIAALADWRAKNIYSLRAPHLKPLLDSHKTLVENSKKLEIAVELDETLPEEPRKEYNPKKSLLSKLEELDG